MVNFFPIETPYDSKDYQIMKKVTEQGIDSHLEGFTKSKFGKSPSFANKFRWDIHTSELPILYRRLKELYDATGDDDYESFLNDVRHVATTSDEAIGAEMDEMMNPYNPMYANQSSNGEPAGESDLRGDSAVMDEVAFEISEEELKEMIKNELASMEENGSDSLTNQHGENLKPQTMPETPQTMAETTDTERYEEVVFMQGDEANEPMEILNTEGKDAAMEFLKQWHQPGLHMGRNEPGHGTQDKTYEKDGYIMSWNPYLPYIGLVYDTEHDQQGQVSEDSQMKRHLAGQREKIGDVPLGQHAPHSQNAMNETKNK